MNLNPHRILYLHVSGKLIGSSWSVYTLINSLDRSRYKPIVCTATYGNFNQYLDQLGVINFSRALHLFGYPARHYIFSEEEREPILPYRISAQLVRTIQLMRAFSEQKLLLRHICAIYRPHLIHINSVTLLVAGIAARYLGIPVIWHVRETLSNNLWGKLAGRAIPRYAKEVIAVSHAVARQLDSTLQNINVIYNAVDLNQFDHSILGISARESLGIPLGIPCIGFIGKLIPSKGIFDFIKAAETIIRKCPYIHFLVVGSATGDSSNRDGTIWRNIIRRVLGNYSKSEYTAKLHNEVKRINLEDRFHFTGYRIDLAKMLAAMDIVVVPSWIEAFGRTVIEAMAMAKAVVASRVDAIPELIESGKTGILVPPHDPQSIAEACLRFINDSSLAYCCGQEAHLSVQTHFTSHQHVQQIQRIYDNILS